MRDLIPLDFGTERRLPIWSRLRSFARRPSFKGSVLRAAASFLTDELVAAAADVRGRARRAPRVLALHEGTRRLDAATSVAAYIHYSPLPVVSDMVLRQLEVLGREGFAVVFISMAPDLPESQLIRLRASCVLVVHRENVGLDFGGWHDVVPLLRRRAPNLRELLLVNDSSCGPFRSLTPIFEAMRNRGDGLFGLTDSIAPKPHLQSYFLLARGRQAVQDLLLFLDRFVVTFSKRRTVRNGEIRLTGWMKGKGHFVGVWCAYEVVEPMALSRAEARDRLRLLYPFVFADIPRGSDDEANRMAEAMYHRPTNATHLFWRELVEGFGFPFVKTELMLRNPLGVAGAVDWKSLVPAGDEHLCSDIEQHLRSMSAKGPSRA